MVAGSSEELPSWEWILLSPLHSQDEGVELEFPKRQRRKFLLCAPTPHPHSSPQGRSLALSSGPVPKSGHTSKASQHRNSGPRGLRSLPSSTSHSPKPHNPQHTIPEHTQLHTSLQDSELRPQIPPHGFHSMTA